MERELQALWDDTAADTSADQSALVATSASDSTNDRDLGPSSRAWLSNGRERR